MGTLLRWWQPREQLMLGDGHAHLRHVDHLAPHWLTLLVRRRSRGSHPPKRTGNCLWRGSGSVTCARRNSSIPSCLPGLMPDRLRIDCCGGVAGPSDDGGGEEFGELRFPRRFHSATCTEAP
jgi:hypothetical protein